MDARRVQVVGGKGGVGRTTVACALALAHAERGERTLLLEVNANHSAAHRLGVAPAPDEPREVLNNLWLCNMTPDGSLREYALLILRFRALYKLVFENRLVKYLLRSIPSLAEVTMAGKFWYHSAETRSPGVPTYDRIILDAPATGHAMTFLGVSRTVADLAPAGRMKREVTQMAELIEAPSTCLHIVTRPEEMPVNEALDLEQAVTERLRMHSGIGFVNAFPDPWLSPSERKCVRRLHDGPGIEPYLRAAEARLSRSERAEAERARLVRRSRLRWLDLPELEPMAEGAAGLAPLVEHLATQLETGPVRAGREPLRPRREAVP